MGSGEGPAKRAILIAGPTASGKSDLAMAIAEELGGIVINADSMQVYADLQIITARPSPSDMERVPHRLFGHIDAADAYSVGRWLGEVQGVLADAWSAERVPVLVGGTGLYLKAMTQGLSDIPPIPDEIRSALRTEAASMTSGSLHSRLAALDPEMARRLRPTDPQRILRALEVFTATGLSLLAYQEARRPPVLPMADLAGVFLDLPRSELNGRINLRFERMMEHGADEEIRRLSARHLDPKLPAMRALGVPQIIAAQSGNVSRPYAVEEGKRSIRQYAKRQVTFARHQLEGLTWIKPSDFRHVITH